jgi:hypothetical protein
MPPTFSSFLRGASTYWCGTEVRHRCHGSERLESGCDSVARAENFWSRCINRAEMSASDARDGPALLSMRTRASQGSRACMETTLTRARSTNEIAARIVQSSPPEGSRWTAPTAVARAGSTGVESDGGGAAGELRLRRGLVCRGLCGLGARHPLRRSQGDDPTQQSDGAGDQAQEDAEGNDLGRVRHDEIEARRRGRCAPRAPMRAEG